MGPLREGVLQHHRIGSPSFGSGCASWCVDGILDRIEYQKRPRRFEYRLTEKGIELYPLIVAMIAWGDRWMAGAAGAPVELIHRRCGHAITPKLICPSCSETHAPSGSEDERDALRTFLEEATLARAGSAPKTLPEDVRRSADPPERPPGALAGNARASGVELDDTAWARLDDDQRYALIKLGDGAKPSHNFKAALEEFLGA